LIRGHRPCEFHTGWNWRFSTKLEDPLTPALSPRGEGVKVVPAEKAFPLPLGRDRVRGSSSTLSSWQAEVAQSRICNSGWRRSLRRFALTMYCR
jgi:hypothetical protein